MVRGYPELANWVLASLGTTMGVFTYTVIVYLHYQTISMYKVESS